MKVASHIVAEKVRESSMRLNYPEQMHKLPALCIPDGPQALPDTGWRRVVNPRRACARVTVVAVCVYPSVTALAASASV